MFGSIFRKRAITPCRVDLGSRSVRVPVADITGNRPGRTLLVTGGMDGDEYAGIEAAYAVIKACKDGDFAGRLIVVPIVNIDGYAGECSQNPVDRKFPKYVFPGKPVGSSTERLMHWLTSTYALHADCWFDLHSGAITEGLNPFLWLYETGVATTDTLAQQLADSGVATTVVFERVRFGGKAQQLARHGCTYIIAESGKRGGRSVEDVARHVQWVTAAMQLLGMIDGEALSGVRSTIYRRVTFYTAPFDGIWRPAAYADMAAAKGALLGICSNLEASKTQAMRFKNDGVRLWWKDTMAMRRGDILCAVAHV